MSVCPPSPAQSIGKPVPNYYCMVLSKSGAPLPVGEVGELYLGGAGVARGYINRDDLTRAAFVRNPLGRSDVVYKTGDLTYWTAEGTLIYVGRADAQVKLRGQRLELQEVESVAVELAFVTDAAALVQNDQLLLIVTPESADITVVLDQLSKRVSTFMVPAHCIPCEALPHTVSGKLDRKKIVELLPPHLKAKDPVKEPDAPTAGNLSAPVRAVSDAAALDAVTAELSAVLGLPSTKAIDPDATFVEAGLDSLAAISLANNLRKRTGVKVKVSLVTSRTATPRTLASHIKETAGAGGVTSVSEARVSSLTVRESFQPEQRIRLLMLHGVAADKTLMELLLETSGWLDGFADVFEFIFIEAPHTCEANETFYEALTRSGAYDPQNKYHRWGFYGVAEEHKQRMVLESIQSVERALVAHAPIHGIGGICEGSLAAACVAARNPSLQLYLNFGSPPWDWVPKPMCDERIATLSVHFLGDADEWYTKEQLMQVPSCCENKLLMRHKRGHVVPLLEDGDRTRLLCLLVAHGLLPESSLVATAPVGSSAPGGRAELNQQQSTAKVLTVIKTMLGKVVKPELPLSDIGLDSLNAFRVIQAIKKEMPNVSHISSAFVATLISGGTVADLLRGIGGDAPSEKVSLTSLAGVRVLCALGTVHTHILQMCHPDLKFDIMYGTIIGETAEVCLCAGSDMYSSVTAAHVKRLERLVVSDAQNGRESNSDVLCRRRTDNALYTASPLRCSCLSPQSISTSSRAPRALFISKARPLRECCRSTGLQSRSASHHTRLASASPLLPG